MKLWVPRASDPADKERSYCTGRGRRVIEYDYLEQYGFLLHNGGKENMSGIQGSHWVSVGTSMQGDIGK